VLRRGRRFEPCKDGETRKVKIPASLLAALRAHREDMALEGRVKDGRPRASFTPLTSPSARWVHGVGPALEAMVPALIPRVALVEPYFRACECRPATFTGQFVVLGSRLAHPTVVAVRLGYRRGDFLPIAIAPMMFLLAVYPDLIRVLPQHPRASAWAVAAEVSRENTTSNAVFVRRASSLALLGVALLTTSTAQKITTRRPTTPNRNEHDTDEQDECG